MHNQLIIKLKEAMKERNIKVPTLSLVTGIPQDRIYKWFKQGTNPKSEDTQILNDWINDETYSRKGKLVKNSKDAKIESLQAELLLSRLNNIESNLNEIKSNQAAY